VERLIDAELERLSRTPPTPAELIGLHRQAQAKLVFGLQDNSARAIWLGAYELLYGDATLLEAQLPRYLAVTGEDLRRVVARYLTPERRARIAVHPVEQTK
jgi:predicted Zn-dependent peptidase